MVEEETVDEAFINITLSADEQEKTSNLMANTVGYGVLDSACTKTVAGEKWMEEYIATLTVEETERIKSTKTVSMSTFKFGDGVATRSKYMVKIPARIGSKSILLNVDVVPCNIPLRISKHTMMKMKMTVDFSKNIAMALGQ